MTDTPLLDVQNLHIRFPILKGLFQRQVGAVNAVNGVSFQIPKGTAFGLVGESGCGKTTVARSVLRLETPSEGTIHLDGNDVAQMDPVQKNRFPRRVQAVFQDPFSSLNPRMTVGAILSEPLRVHRLKSSSELSGEVLRLLDLCGLPSRFANLYPHEMSGGQRQRVGIARALAMSPELIVCDEAVSALDVSIQAQIITLLEDLQQELGLTYLFIAHDLSVVRHLCDQVAVMYLGRIVEQGPSEHLFANPAHPYTQALIDAVPNPDPDFEGGREIVPLLGEVPSPANLPSGCFFHPRCAKADARCIQEAPPFSTIDACHLAACWHPAPEFTQQNKTMDPTQTILEQEGIA